MSKEERYVELCRNPGDLFPGCLVVLYPFDEQEIWIGDGKKCGFRIKAEKTERGLCLHISVFSGSPPIKIINPTDSQVELCQETNGFTTQSSGDRISKFLRALEN